MENCVIEINIILRISLRFSLAAWQPTTRWCLNSPCLGRHQFSLQSSPGGIGHCASSVIIINTVTVTTVTTVTVTNVIATLASFFLAPSLQEVVLGDCEM